MAATMTTMCVCRHCGWERWHLGRGLCERCYRNKHIRVQYPPLGRGEQPKTLDTTPEPTEAELEAIIAEQMQCLPWWWHHDDEGLEQQAAALRAEYSLVRLMRRR